MAIHSIKNKIKGNKRSKLCLETKNIVGISSYLAVGEKLMALKGKGHFPFCGVFSAQVMIIILKKLRQKLSLSLG